MRNMEERKIFLALSLTCSIFGAKGKSEQMRSKRHRALEQLASIVIIQPHMTVFSGEGRILHVVYNIENRIMRSGNHKKVIKLNSRTTTIAPKGAV